MSKRFEFSDPNRHNYHMTVFIIIMLTGGELMKHIYSKGRLDEVETRKYMRQIISAVDHLHRAGIIHRYLYA